MSEETSPDGGKMGRPGVTPPDLLAERFGTPENDRRGGAASVPWPSDQRGPTYWWGLELESRNAQRRRKTLAEEVESDGEVHGCDPGDDDPDGRGGG